MHHIFDELELFCCSCFYIIWINENLKFMRFCRLDECFETNDMLSIRPEKNSVFLNAYFEIYHVCFDCFMYILHVSNLLKKFTKQVLDSTCKIGREKKCILENYDFILFDHKDTSIFNPENFCSRCKFKLLSRMANKELHCLNQSFVV